MQQLLGTIVAAMHALAVPTDFRPNACNPAPVSRSSSNCTHLPACLPACLLAHLPAAGGVQGAGGMGHL